MIVLYRLLQFEKNGKIIYSWTVQINKLLNY